MELIAVHADWSADPRKCWFTLARRRSSGWQAEAPARVGDPARFSAALLAEGGAVALGLDVPLGVPQAYGLMRPEPDFIAFLRHLATRPGFFAVAERIDEVSQERPFFPARSRKGVRRDALANALGLRDRHALMRLCDRATAERPAGAPVFWTLGANQSGKAAITAWRDWLSPALIAQAPYRLWPFEGGLHALLGRGRIALAELYPAEALRHCGIVLPGSKRRQQARAAVATAVRAALAARRIHPSPALRLAIEEGFGPDATGEDRFDSLIGLIGLIGVIDGFRPDFIPADPMIRRWEGWVLGQTALPREAQEKSQSRNHAQPQPLCSRSEEREEKEGPAVSNCAPPCPV